MMPEEEFDPVVDLMSEEFRRGEEKSDPDESDVDEGNAEVVRQLFLLQVGPHDV